MLAVSFVANRWLANFQCSAGTISLTALLTMRPKFRLAIMQ